MRYDYHFTHSSHIRFCGWQYCELLVFLCTEYVIHDMQTSFKLSTMIMSESWLYWWTSLCSIQKYSNICKDVVTSDTYSWNCGPQFLVCHCSAHSSLKVGCTKLHQRYLNHHLVNLWQLTLRARCTDLTKWLTRELTIWLSVDALHETLTLG